MTLLKKLPFRYCFRRIQSTRLYPIRDRTFFEISSFWRLHWRPLFHHFFVFRSQTHFPLTSSSSSAFVPVSVPFLVLIINWASIVLVGSSGYIAHGYIYSRSMETTVFH